jgi:hypothetical protein
VGDEDLAARGDHAADRGVDAEALGEERQALAARVDLEERVVLFETEDARVVVVDAGLGDEQRAVGVEGDGAGCGEASDVGTEVKAGRVLDEGAVDRGLVLEDFGGGCAAGGDEEEGEGKGLKAKGERDGAGGVVYVVAHVHVFPLRV